jgi:hypothetical protein
MEDEMDLTRRYVVTAMATEGPFDTRDPDGAFVLKPWKDPAALHALRAYAERCYPELARDLAGWMRAIERGPVVRGDVGRRNEAHARTTARPRRGAAATAGKPKARSRKRARPTKTRRRR